MAPPCSAQFRSVLRRKSRTEVGLRGPIRARLGMAWCRHQRRDPTARLCTEYTTEAPPAVGSGPSKTPGSPFPFPLTGKRAVRADVVRLAVSRSAHPPQKAHKLHAV